MTASQTAVTAASDIKTVLFYGDSNTWGYDPSSGLRYPYRTRWTTVCAQALGSGFNCIPAGMNGRTTAFDDPEKGARNGLVGLDYELQSHKPIDLLVIMLGTNDMKYTDAEGSAAGMERLIERALTVNRRFGASSPVFMEPGSARGLGDGAAGSRILIISPVTLSAHLGCRGDDIESSARLAGAYRRIAQRHGLYFMDAARYASASDIDGVHLGPEGHQRLGAAAAERIRGIFALGNGSEN